MEDGQLQGGGVRVAHLHGAQLVGNCRKLHLETMISDLEYADDMVLVAESWDDLKAMLALYQCTVGTYASPSATGKPGPWQYCHQIPEPNGFRMMSLERWCLTSNLGSIVQDDCSSARQTQESARPPRPFVLCAVSSGTNAISRLPLSSVSSICCPSQHALWLGEFGPPWTTDPLSSGFCDVLPRWL